MIFYDYFSVFYLILVNFYYFPLRENLSDHLFMLIFILSARQKALWYSFPTDQTRIFSVERWKRRGLQKEEMEGKVFISNQSRHISFVIIMIKVLFYTLYQFFSWHFLNITPRNVKQFCQDQEVK